MHKFLRRFNFAKKGFEKILGGSNSRLIVLVQLNTANWILKMHFAWNNFGNLLKNREITKFHEKIYPRKVGFFHMLNYFHLIPFWRIILIILLPKPKLLTTNNLFAIAGTEILKLLFWYRQYFIFKMRRCPHSKKKIILQC